MEMPRRNFLKTGALTAVAAGVAIGSVQTALSQAPGRGPRANNPTGVDIPLRAQLDPLYMFTHQTFAPYIGDVFEAAGLRGNTVGLKLVQVSPFKPNVASKLAIGIVDRSDSFTLTFNADEKLSNISSIHNLSHPALGKFDVFLTSREAQDGTLIYEAVFNHLR